jgi:hypothetical protein
MKLKWNEHLLALLLVLAGFVFTVLQKNFIPAVFLRSVALLAVVSGLAFIFFLAKKPVKPLVLSRYLCFYWGTIAVVIVAVEHVIIKFDLSYKQAIIMADVLTGPFIAGYIYGFPARKKGGNTGV